MKKVWQLTLMGIISILLGSIPFIIEFNWSRFTKITSTILLIEGVIFITIAIILRIGLIRPKVYRFVHLYKNADILDNTTTIIGKLNKKDITRLRNQQGNQPIDEIFKWCPVLVDVKVHFKKNDNWHYTQVVGWIYASNPDEAKRTLHYYTFDDNNEDNTPCFFNIDE